jgi:hypothetical protein
MRGLLPLLAFAGAVIAANDTYEAADYPTSPTPSDYDDQITSTITLTTDITITSCPPEITDCPARTRTSSPSTSSTPETVSTSSPSPSDSGYPTSPTETPPETSPSTCAPQTLTETSTSVSTCYETTTQYNTTTTTCWETTTESTTLNYTTTILQTITLVNNYTTTDTETTVCFTKHNCEPKLMLNRRAPKPQLCTMGRRQLAYVVLACECTIANIRRLPLLLTYV